MPKHTSSPIKFIPKGHNGRPLRTTPLRIHSTPHIIIATETWLSPSISSAELESDGFNVYRRDRKTGAGGGVLIAVNNKISSSEYYHSENRL